MKVSPKFNTLIQTSASGLEARQALMTLTRREWDLNWSRLCQSLQQDLRGNQLSVTQFAVEQLQGFYLNQFGPLSSFFFRDQFQNTVTAGFITTVQNPVSTTGTASSGSLILTVASAAGIFLGWRPVGSGIQAGTVVSAINGLVITLSLVTTAPLSSTALTFYDVTFQAQRFMVAGSAETGSGPSYAEPVFCFDQRASYTYAPYIRSAGLSPQLYDGSSPVAANFDPETGLITLTGSPVTAGHSMFATFSYGFRCRFSDDSIDFDNIFAFLHEAQSIKIIETRT